MSKQLMKGITHSNQSMAQFVTTKGHLVALEIN